MVRDQVHITMNGNELALVETMRYLGVLLDYELSYKPYVRSLLKTLHYKSYLLKQVQYYLPKHALLRIYKSYIIPLIDYADVLYNGVVEDYKLKLQRVQSKCLKICEKVHRLTATTGIHKTTNMPLLKDRREYHMKLLAFKRAQIPKYRRTVTRATRLADGPVLMYYTIHSNAYEHSVEVQCAWSWNAIQPYLRNIETIDEFKNLAKIVLQDTINAL